MCLEDSGNQNVKGIAMEIGEYMMISAMDHCCVRFNCGGSNHHVWKLKQRNRDFGHPELGTVEACNHLNLLASNI